MVFAHRTIKKIWHRQEAWSRGAWLTLTPFSLLFSLGVRGRNLLYDFRFLPITQVPLNVISIGNLTVGGTGKTPLTLGLAQSLQQRGYQVGILTRGYKGRAVGPTLVGRDGTPLALPTAVGDEAVLLARRFPGIVIAGRDRVAAATFAHTNFALDVVILDDGFQHRRLHRTVEILLFSGQGGTNSWLLPAGPFREPFSAMHRADILVLTKQTAKMRDFFSCIPSQLKARLKARSIPTFTGELVPTSLIQIVNAQWQERPLLALAGKRVMTVTAIADPTPFYHTLQEQGAKLMRVVEFPDHHSYTHLDWHRLETESRGFDWLVTTEKDLVKLELFSPMSDRLVALRIQMQLEPAELFLAAVEQRFRYKRKG